MPFRLSERTSNSKALSTICRFVLSRVSFFALRTKVSLMSILVLMEKLYTNSEYFCALRFNGVLVANCPKSAGNLAAAHSGKRISESSDWYWGIGAQWVPYASRPEPDE